MSEKLKDKRNFLDGLITSSERSGEGFQGIMDRLVGVKGEKTNL